MAALKSAGWAGSAHYSRIQRELTAWIQEHARILLSQPELFVSFLLSRGAGTAPLPLHLLARGHPSNPCRGINSWERRKGQPRLPGRAETVFPHGETRKRGWSSGDQIIPWKSGVWRCEGAPRVGFFLLASDSGMSRGMCCPVQEPSIFPALFWAQKSGILAHTCGFGVALWDSKLLQKRLGDVIREMDFSFFFFGDEVAT